MDPRERLEREAQALLDALRDLPEVPEPLFRLLDRLFALVRLGAGADPDALVPDDIPTRPEGLRALTPPPMPATRPTPPPRTLSPMHGLHGLAERVRAHLEKGQEPPEE